MPRMTRFAQAERRALCDTLIALGPDAPTLCHPWRTRDLAAHLVLRDSRPDLAAGLVIKPLARRLDRAMAEKAKEDYATLVDWIRYPPAVALAARLAPVDEAFNTLEFFIHHEDVLRASPGFTARALDPDHEHAVWAALKGVARLLYRRSSAGVILVTPRFGRYVAKGTGESGTAVLTGEVAELALYSYGRKNVADVDMSGPDEAVEAVRGTRLSLP